MRAAFVAALAAVAGLACKSDRSKPPEIGGGYYRCGSQVCIKVVVNTKIGSDLVWSVGGPTAVYVPLRGGVKARKFKVLGNRYGTDGRRLWCGKRDPIPFVSPKGFRHLGGALYVVNGAVRVGCDVFFVDDGKTLRSLDPTDTTALPCGVVRTRSRLFATSRATEHPFKSGFVLSDLGVDPGTMGFDHNCGAYDRTGIYQLGRHGTIVKREPLKGPFRQYRHYAVAGQYVFGVRKTPSSVSDHARFPDSALVAGADAPTFTVFKNGRYARDAAHAYWDGILIPGADAQTFAAVPGAELLARDDRRAYLEGRVIEEVEGATVQPIKAAGCTAELTGYSHFRDAKQVYFGTRRIDGADPATFALFNAECGSFYGHDGKRVYWEHRVVPDAAPANFEVFPHGFGADGDRAYRNGIPLSRTDREWFRVTRERAERARGKGAR